MSIVTFALAAICVIFSLISLMVPLASALRLPFPVVVAVAGLTVGTIFSLLGVQSLGIGLDSYDLWFVESLALDTNTLLLVFLPPLLFEMSLAVSIRRLRNEVWVVLALAVVAVILATGAVGLVLWTLSSLSLVACLLVGAAISTTDPAAVISTFREIGAPRRLGLLLEGESLLNDAAAIALFTLLIGIAAGTGGGGPFNLAVVFLFSFVFGAITGALLAWFASRLFPLLGGSAAAEATLTVAIPHASYLLAESAGASGVVAVVFAGMMIRYFGFAAMGPRNWSTVMILWSQIGFWANALILLFAATLVPKMLLGLSLQQALLIPVVYVGAFVARAIVLFGLLPLLTRARLTAPIPIRQGVLAWWGGVRGAVTIILALGLAEISTTSGDDVSAMAAIGTGFVFLTLLVNASTLALVTRLLGLDKLNRSDAVLRSRVVSETRKEIQRFVDRLIRERGEPSEFMEEMRRFSAHDLPVHVDRENGDRIELGEGQRLGLIILANQELRLIEQAFEDGVFGRTETQNMTANAEALADAARIGGRNSYIETVLQQLNAPREFRLALFLHRSFEFDRPLRRQLEAKLTVMLGTATLLQQLGEYSQSVLPAIIGGEAAANVDEALAERRASTRRSIDALALQYPDYTRKLELVLLMRAVIRREQAQYEQLLIDGAVSVDLHRALQSDLAERARELSRPPRLDLRQSPLSLISRVPIFRTLTPAQQEKIAALLTPRIALPGETIVATNDRGSAMFFIVSGVVSIEGLNTEAFISNGDFFGELSLLAPTRRRTTGMIAATACQLLVLHRSTFRRLRSTDPEIEKTIRTAAERQLGDGFLHRQPEDIERANWRKSSEVDQKFAR